MFNRAMSLELIRDNSQSDEKSNVVRCIASTDTAYDWGQFREQLVHDNNSVDRSAAASVLFNHKRDEVIGKILATEISGGRMTAELEIDPEVRGTNGLPLLRAIKQGYIRGVSIGYEYQREACDFSEDEKGKRTVKVNAWTLREISITPTPADVGAAVTRSLPEWLQPAPTEPKPTGGYRNMEFTKWLSARGMSEASLSADQVKALRAAFDAEVISAEKAAAEAKQAEVVAAERAAKEKAEAEAAAAKFSLEMIDFARSHGVSVTADELAGKTRDACQALIAERKAALETEKKPVSNTNVDVTRDAADKVRSAAVDGLLHMAGQTNKSDANQGMRNLSVLDMIRKLALANGLPAADMSKRELAYWALGTKGQNEHIRSANVTSGMFTSYVLANVMDKAVQNGFNNFGDAVTYPLWTVARSVPDFKSFTGAALDQGNLVETTENLPFPELAKDEDGYSSSLGLWGATISLSFQAIVNDDLSQFMTMLGRAGAIARRTIDKKVYTVVNAATWTNKTTATGALADGTLAKGRAAYETRTGPASEVLGNVARYLLVPSCLREAALKQTIAVQGATSFNANTDLQPIVTPYLTQATTAASSKHYLAADPRLVDTLIVATLQGVDSPIVEEYDAGAAAARKWKIYMPFVCVLPTTLPGMHQCTAS